MNTSVYFRMLAENRFRVHPTRLPMLLANGLSSVVNSTLSLIQALTRNSAIRQTEIEKSPIFIVGHWRSGTTLTHELMSRDRNFGYPDNYSAFVPRHFLVSGFLRPIMNLMLPAIRPVDNMPVAVDLPQEDDFAILSMGGPTHYRRIAFPENQDAACRLLDCDNLTADESADLERVYRYFLQALTLRSGKQLVLKSPPHTGRIRLLLNWFPNAKFVHLCRHPYQLVPSTMRLWSTTDEVQAFQKPHFSEGQMLDYIERCQTTLYGAYARDRGLLRENQLIEISFEQLTTRPAATMSQIYEKLELDGVEAIIESTNSYFEQRKDHKKNVHRADPIRNRIDSTWADYMARFGYS